MGSVSSAELDPQTIIANSQVLAVLPKEAVRALAAVARFERYGQRTLLVAKGNIPEHVRYVIDGSVDLTMFTRDGKVSALPVFPGTWATWLSCMSDRPMPWDMWSSRSACYLALPRQIVQTAVSQHPQALLQVIEYVGSIQRALIEWMLNVSLQPPQKRLAYLLLMSAQGSWTRPEPGGSAPITQEQIGNLGLGSRQKVGRLLRDLERLKLVELGYGAVFVPSWERLNAYVFQ
jgi:CRP/FNR family transcriptional regulator, cyclic AMP receptor protein